MGMKSIVTASALATGLGVLWAPPAIAGEPSAAAPAEAQPRANDTSRRVCRNLIRSGTRLSTRYCRTQAEWDEAGEGARRFLQEGQNEGSSRDGEMNVQRGSQQSPRQ
jgi:hypothetical protein